MRTRNKPEPSTRRNAKNETLEGFNGKRSSTVRKLQFKTQRLIRPLAVVTRSLAEPSLL